MAIPFLQCMFFAGGCRLQSTHHHANMPAARWQVSRHWTTGSCCGPRSESIIVYFRKELYHKDQRVFIHWFIGFLAVVWFGSSPLPPFCQQVPFFLRLPMCLSSSLPIIEWFTEDQSFSPSDDLAPPHPPPPSSVGKLCLFLRLPMCLPSSFPTIEWFTEDQAFSPAYGGSYPNLPPLPLASCLSFSVFLCVACRAYWRERGEWRRGWGRSQTMCDGENAWSSVNHLILSNKDVIYSLQNNVLNFFIQTVQHLFNTNWTQRYQSLSSNARWN